ncbi:MAG: sulfurtransferase [Nevskia sp.]|nr:sulfurtransferase [Nevskia sp.]
MQNLDPDALKALLDAGKVRLLDVREPVELDIARIEGAVHIPLGELAGRLDELRGGLPLVALCHHGVRSELAGRILERNGFTGVAHLSGGIDAWSVHIDPSVPRY